MKYKHEAIVDHPNELKDCWISKDNGKTIAKIITIFKSTVVLYFASGPINNDSLNIKDLIKQKYKLRVYTGKYFEYYKIKLSSKFLNYL